MVGHSNTTPALVEALGGDPGSPIESLEYDRLYMVTFEGGVGTYGPASVRRDFPRFRRPRTLTETWAGGSFFGVGPAW